MNQINLFCVFNHNGITGFAVLETETYSDEDINSRALFGIGYDKEDKVICIDFLWRMFFISL